MKITKVTIDKFNMPLAEPFEVAFGVIEAADSWIVKIETDEGLYGLGSASPLAFVTGETSETCRLVMDMFAKAFIGFDPLDIAGAHALMESLITATVPQSALLMLPFTILSARRRTFRCTRCLAAPTRWCTTTSPSASIRPK